MSFSNKTFDGVSKYAYLSKGKIITKIDGQKKEFTTIEGKIIGLDIVEETYKGETYDKTCIYIMHEVDGKPVVTILQMRMDSGYGIAFACISPYIDFSKNCEISSGWEEGENETGFGRLFIAQEGKPLKWYFKHSNTDPVMRLPEAKEKTVNRKKVKDWSDRNNFIYELLTQKVYERIKKGWTKEERALFYDATKLKDDQPVIDEPEEEIPF